jgi:hypothetical protein
MFNLIRGIFLCYNLKKQKLLDMNVEVDERIIKTNKTKQK